MTRAAGVRGGRRVTNGVGRKGVGGGRGRREGGSGRWEREERRKQLRAHEREREGERARVQERARERRQVLFGSEFRVRGLFMVIPGKSAEQQHCAHLHTTHSVKHTHTRSHTYIHNHSRSHKRSLSYTCVMHVCIHNGYTFIWLYLVKVSPGKGLNDDFDPLALFAETPTPMHRHIIIYSVTSSYIVSHHHT